MIFCVDVAGNQACPILVVPFPGQKMSMGDVKRYFAEMVTFLPTLLSELAEGGQTVVFVKQLLSGEQVVTAPLSVVSVTTTWSLGTPIPTDLFSGRGYPRWRCSCFPGAYSPCL